jgi:PhnB protein
MTSIQPELWVDRGAEAIAFYQEAFDARVLHVVGSGEDIVAQLAVGDAAFWIAATESGGDRLVPRIVGGRTGRTLLVVEDPDSRFSRAVAADERHSSLGAAWLPSGIRGSRPRPNRPT